MLHFSQNHTYLPDKFKNLFVLWFGMFHSLVPKMQPIITQSIVVGILVFL